MAEVLITLAVIGIVAALTIGIFLPKIHSQIRAHQIAIAETKFTKAMEQMALNNAVGPYYETTKDFVDELQNYLKVAKVCDNEHLADCFGYEALTVKEGEELELAEIKTGENLGKDENYLETVGLVTIDGTGMILSWNKECPILEPKVYQWGNNTNETTSCVAAILDINLDKSPNRINKDVALFRAESPSKTAGFKIGGVTWGTPFLVDVALTNADCEANKSTYGITNCRSGNDDYWGYAMKTCKEQGKNLPTMEQLGKLAAYLYNQESVGAYQDIDSDVIDSDVNIDTDKLANFSETLYSSYTTYNNWFTFWSSAEDSTNNSYGRFFNDFNTGYGSHDRSDSPGWGVCVW